MDTKDIRIEKEPKYGIVSFLAESLLTAISFPYRWFTNIVKLREKRRMGFLALFGVICFVSFTRAELEILTTRSSRFSIISILNNVAFYLQSAYAYALLASWFTRKNVERVTGIIVLGIFLGIFPPILDTTIWGADTGYYNYISDGFSTWDWTLVNPKFYSLGEAVTLWILTFGLALYVLEDTRRLLRGVGALLSSYLTVVFISLGPSTLTLELVKKAPPFSEGSWLFFLTLSQIFVAQVLYLVIRPSLAVRLGKRLIHAAPFVALTLLGGALAELFSASGLNHKERLHFSILACWLIFELCVVALVQNDAYDARTDNRTESEVSHEDAQFFTVNGILLVLTTLYALPGLGLPMSIFLCVSTLYSYDFYRAKRFFPANYKIEGIWGWSSFVAGGSIQLSLTPVRIVSPSFLLASFFVFGGWSLFNVFKDYKDIRSDYKAGNQTLYVLAIKSGIKLCKLHRTLRAALMISIVIPSATLLAAGIEWKRLAIITVCSEVLLFRALGGPPRKNTVLSFLFLITVYVFSLTLLIEYSLRYG